MIVKAPWVLADVVERQSAANAWTNVVRARGVDGSDRGYVKNRCRLAQPFINGAVGCGRGMIRKPTRRRSATDQPRGGVDENRRAVITLLALSDEGAPANDHALAATLGVPPFACTTDACPGRWRRRFGDMMAKTESSGSWRLQQEQASFKKRKLNAQVIHFTC
jgi:hypothetical protein